MYWRRRCNGMCNWCVERNNDTETAGTIIVEWKRNRERFTFNEIQGGVRIDSRCRQGKLQRLQK